MKKIIEGSKAVKSGLAQMLKGGVIMDLVFASKTRVAESAEAAAVTALERAPADIRAEGRIDELSRLFKQEKFNPLWRKYP